MQDISFDFETLSLERDACILSLGAVRFDRNTGETGARFYAVAEIENQPGAIIDPSTVVWWMRQSAEAREGVFGKESPRVSIYELLRQFVAFAGDAAWMWSSGAKDAEWLESAFRRCEIQNPWKYWQFCDQRTLRNLFGDYIYHCDTGVAHNALSDAVRQAEQLCDIFNAARLTGLSI